MSKTPQPKCPECEKLSAVADRSQELGFFLEWMANQGIVLSKWDYNVSGEIIIDGTDFPVDKMLMPCYEFKGDAGINKLLANYFGIDLDKVEQERRALLEWLREQHNEN